MFDETHSKTEKIAISGLMAAFFFFLCYLVAFSSVSIYHDLTMEKYELHYSRNGNDYVIDYNLSVKDCVLQAVGNPEFSCVKQ